MTPPTVFISYSHDSAAHKQWVMDFATTLRNRGVDAVLDQWDLKPGDDLPHFMETQLASADFALMICTERYVQKANAGEGGVGYEKMIMTSSLLGKIDSSKVIPIIRQAGSKDVPTFLKTKLYVDFSNDEDVEYSLDELLRVLLNAPLFEKPEIGANPFKPLEGSRPDRTSDRVREVMEAIAYCYDNRKYEYVRYEAVLGRVSVHRLVLDRYLNAARDGNLIRRERDLIYITEDGINYLIGHGIIEE